MFTVKHVDGRGNWKVSSAVDVAFDAERDVLTYTGANGPVEIDHGHVYVMNELGKTVSVYNPGKKEQKHG